MSESEDYLDQLLKGVFEQEDALDEDLFDIDEDFLEEFEQEMQKMEEDSEDSFKDTENFEMTAETDSDEAWNIGALESILNGAKEQMEAVTEEPEKEVSAEEPVIEKMLVEEPIEEDAAIAESGVDKDVLKILDSLGDIDLEAEMEAEAFEEPAPEAGKDMFFGGQEEELSETNMELLKELDDSGTLEKTSETKKKKKEKKKKEKKPKVKKEKKPKVKKEKKPRPPKEPDNTPPLPKKPVFLIFALVASAVVFIMVGTNLFGYANQFKYAKDAYVKKKYSEAFSYISGLDVKERDEEIYQKYQVMALVSSELEAYESFMNAKMYEMALDCLVRTVGRYEKYKEDAADYGCIDELNALELEAETILSDTFGVSREEALDFYSYKSRKEYSTALTAVVEKLGIE